jgi:hypothetical protein
MAFTPTQIGGIDADRYGIKKNTEWVFVPTIADADFALTEAELNAGSNLTCAIEALNGFNVSPRYAELQDMCSDVDGKVFDGASLDDSSISFYLAEDDNDALDFFTVGDAGYLVHAPRGLISTARAWVWKVEVSVVTPTVATAGGSMGSVGFAVTALRKIDLPTET